MMFRRIQWIVATTLLFSTTLFAQTQEQEKVFIKNARQLIYDGKRSGEGYFSGDGNNLVFQSERDEKNPFYQIFNLDLTTGDVTQISPGDGKTTCAYYNWNGNKEIMYGSTHHDPKVKEKMQEELDFRASGQKRRYSWDYDETMDIFVSDLKGNVLRQVTKEKGYDAEGSFSPDGKLIAFCSNRSAYEGKLTPEEEKIKEFDLSYFGDIYIMNADGSNVKRLTNSPGYDGGPFFSPDGKRIIWRRFNEKGTSADVYSMKIDGSDVQQITDFGSMSWAPYYHPTMDYVIFASNKLGFSNFELFIVDAAGTKEPVQVSYTDGFDGLPVFSPDGNKIAWTSTRTSTGQSHIFYANWDHKSALDALKAAPLRGETGSNYTPQIKASELQDKVSYLASDELEGRMTGSKGIKEAADWITGEYKSLGLQPLGDLKDYTQSFEFIADMKVDKSATKLSAKVKRKTTEFELINDFVPASFSKNATLSGDVVFAGYGLKTPGSSSVPYNSYSGLDVKGKIVVVLRGEPEHLEDEDKKQVVRYSTFRYKTMTAREEGAAAIIMIDAYDKTFKGVGKETVPGDMGIPAFIVNPSVGDVLLGAVKKDVEQVKKDLLTYNPHAPSGYALDNLTIDLGVKLDRVKSTDVNLIGVLTAGTKTDEYIMLGGHYDHLGYGETGSRATGDELHHIHNGADDNASGTATVLELAEYFSDLKKQDPSAITKNIIFVMWSGEELGLVGSGHFTENSPIKMEQIKAYLNFDMVGSLKDNKLILQGLGSADEWKGIVEKKNVLAGFNLALQDDPYVPTDGMAIYQAGVPILCFFTGITDEYHTPADDVETINFDGMERINKFAMAILKELMKPDTKLPYKEVSMAETMNTGRGFTVYLGTIPDYAAEVAGVKLDGVRADGPAAEAGLQKDDIIVGLADKEIGNIYDYTYALSDLKPDVTVDIVIERDGKKKTLKITPKAK